LWRYIKVYNITKYLIKAYLDLSKTRIWTYMSFRLGARWIVWTTSILPIELITHYEGKKKPITLNHGPKTFICVNEYHNALWLPTRDRRRDHLTSEATSLDHLTNVFISEKLLVLSYKLIL
jgi:hypothetical protein